MIMCGDCGKIIEKCECSSKPTESQIEEWIDSYIDHGGYILNKDDIKDLAKFLVEKMKGKK